MVGLLDVIDDLFNVMISDLVVFVNDVGFFVMCFSDFLVNDSVDFLKDELND